MSAALTIVVVLTLAVYAVLASRAMKKVRQGDEDWRRRWRELPPERRRAITRTMRRGEAVRDPEDAALALRALAQMDHVRAAMRPLERLALPALVAMLVAAVLAGVELFVVIVGVGLAVALVSGALSERQRRRAHQSAEATRRLRDREP